MLCCIVQIYNQLARDNNSTVCLANLSRNSEVNGSLMSAYI